MKVERDADGRPRWTFDGRGWLELPRRELPPLGGDRAIRLKLTVQAHCHDGVILAHGGDRWGYAIYLKDGRPALAACVDWKRTVLVADDPIDEKPHEWEMRFNGDGRLFLRIDGRLVAQGSAAGPLRQMPGDTMQVGADLVKPVGDYQPPHPFRGVITGLTGFYAR